MGGKFRLRAVSLAALIPVIVACNDDQVRGFQIESISFSAARAMIEGQPTRVELELHPSWAVRVAREMEIAPEHRYSDDERIESRVIRPGFAELASDGACAGVLALELLGVRVAFDESTRFEGQDGERISCVQFVTLVESYVALGQEPQITAERRPGAVPQDPHDSLFLAAELMLDDEDHDGDQRPEVELLLGADNLVSCDEIFSPPSDCVGAIRALGMLFAIGSESTEIELADPEPRLSARFKGIVTSVNLEKQEVRLNTGAVLQLVRGSEIEWGEADRGVLFTSLEDVQEGLDIGRLIEAHGNADILGTDPLVLWVREVEFEIERDLSPSDYRNVVRIEGEVLDVQDGFVELPFDTRLRITEVSSLEGFLELSEIGNAMVAGSRVRADARVVVEEVRNPTLVTRADRVTFVLDGLRP